MKLLFDQNLSEKLYSLLSDIYFESCHVKQASMEREDDVKIWQYAKENY